MKNRWDNMKTVLRPTTVAKAFADTPLLFSPQLRELAHRAVALFESGDPEGCKALLGREGPVEFDGSSDYHAWAQFRAFFTKSSLPGRLGSCRDSAWKKFLHAERACKRANKRLRYYWSRPDRENPIYRVVLSRARELIRSTLGNFTAGTYESILEACRPGGGSSVGTLDYRRVTPAFKFDLSATELCVSEAALPHATSLVEGSQVWLRTVADVDWVEQTWSVDYKVANYNRVAHVPKDAVTTRTIAVEPHLNMCLQLGAGEVLARRLRRVGIDLASQQYNQSAARRGAAGWMEADPLVTIDLSSASDTLSIALVERLLPPLWCEFLGNIRSSHYKVGNADPVEYQKWSSMGNGTTFPLETLVFWALARSVASFLDRPDAEVWVYGDDIVVPRSTAFLLIEILAYCGFKTNREKTFLFGPFRESCGEDWWEIERVVPVYLRYMEQLQCTDIYRLLNTLPEHHKSSALSGLLLRAHRGMRVLRGPPNASLAANHLFTPLDELIARREVRWSGKWQSWTHETAVYKPVHRSVSANAAYLAALLGSSGSASDFPRSTLRGRGRWATSVVSCG